MGGSRIRRGWDLAKRSYGVLRSNRSLMTFPVVSLLASLVTAAVFFGPGVAIYSSDGQEPVLILFGIITLYALAAVTLFFNTALAAAASQALAGRTPTVADGMAVARDRLGPIGAWALVQTTVSVAIAALEALVRDNLIGRLATSLANFAWGVATFFVVPVIALEGVGPKEALKRSVAVLRERWGEGAVGAVSVTLPVFLAALPLLIIFGGGGYALRESAPAAAVLLFTLAGVVLIAYMVVSGTLGVIFRVALYEFATTGDAPGEFASADLDHAFRPKSGRRSTV